MLTVDAKQQHNILFSFKILQTLILSPDFIYLFFKNRWIKQTFFWFILFFIIFFIFYFVLFCFYYLVLFFMVNQNEEINELILRNILAYCIILSSFSPFVIILGDFFS